MKIQVQIYSKYQLKIRSQPLRRYTGPLAIKKVMLNGEWVDREEVVE
ncbi:hypothetical protein [Cyclobacterium salsum]|nr:hypothetical protein [Cyclobacterium salsum]